MRALQPRERLLLTVAIVIVSILLVYLVIFRGYIGGLQKLDNKIEQKRAELKNLEALWDEYSEIKELLPSLESRLAKSDFSLLAELEELSTKANVKEHIDSMQDFAKPQNEFYRESAVRVKLKELTLDQLVNYLYNIEHASTLLRVKSLVVERSYANPELLDIQLEVSTFSQLASTHGSYGGTTGLSVEREKSPMTKKLSK